MLERTESDHFAEMRDFITTPTTETISVLGPAMIKKIIRNKTLTSQEKFKCLRMNCSSFNYKVNEVIGKCNAKVKNEYLDFLIASTKKETVKEIIGLLEGKDEYNHYEQKPLFEYFKDESTKFITLLKTLLENEAGASAICKLLIIEKPTQPRFTFSNLLINLIHDKKITQHYISFLTQLTSECDDLHEVRKLFILKEKSPQNKRDFTLGEAVINKFQDKQIAREYINLLSNLIREKNPHHICHLFVNHIDTFYYVNSIKGCHFGELIAKIQDDQTTQEYLQLLVNLLQTNMNPAAILNLLKPTATSLDHLADFVIKHDEKTIQCYLSLLAELINKINNPKFDYDLKKIECISDILELLSDDSIGSDSFIVALSKSKHTAAIYQLFDERLLTKDQYHRFVNKTHAITNFILNLKGEEKLYALKNVIEQNNHPLYKLFRLSYFKTIHHLFHPAETINEKPNIEKGDLKRLNDELQKLKQDHLVEEKSTLRLSHSSS